MLKHKIQSLFLSGFGDDDGDLQWNVIALNSGELII